MEIDLINLITILNLHLFWEEYSKITHNFSNYNNKHFKYFRSLHIYLSNDAAVYSSSLLRNISFAIFPPPQKLDNSSQMPLLSHSSLIAISFSPFLFALLLFLVLHLFFFLFLFPFQQDSSRFSSERARMRDAQGGSAIIESVSVAPGDFRGRGVKWTRGGSQSSSLRKSFDRDNHVLLLSFSLFLSRFTFSSEKVNGRGMERMEKGEGWNLYSLSTGESIYEHFSFFFFF